MRKTSRTKKRSGRASSRKKRTTSARPKRALRVCFACKKKNARVQIIPMSKANAGHVKLDSALKRKKARPVYVCNRKDCIAKTLDRKQFDFWVKLPAEEQVKEAVLSK